MDTTSNDISSISGCDSLTARLRRLKIQEGIFINNVRNSLLKCPDYKENNDHSNELKLKIFLSNLKKSYIEIKNLFEDVKLKTHFQGTIEKYDIDELKRDITELETKIKSFKQYSQNELRTLQYEETVIKEKASQASQAKLKIPVLPTKQYNEVVTSPVRVIINSPFKCLEVQRFQDFMKSSPNKCGGWNEYNHNTFVQIWRKYFGDSLMITNYTEEPSMLIDFKNEVLSKISGLKPDDIVSHEKWYSEYLRLKRNQENALNLWKENRRKIKRPLREKKTEISDGGSVNSIISTRQNILAKETLKKTSLDDELSNNSQTELRDTVLKDTKQRYMKPTKQWINKRNSIEEVTFRNYDVDNITKLHTPTWRANVKNSYIINKYVT